MNQTNFLSASRINLIYIGISCFLFCVLGIFCQPGGFYFDIFCWINWTSFFKDNCFHNIYAIGANYLPGFLYVLKIFSSFGDKEFIASHIHYLKFFILLFHFLNGYLLLQILIKSNVGTKLSLAGAIVFTLLPGSLFNTILWGQVDEMLTFFLFLSFYFSIKQKPYWAIIAMVMALLVKLQGIIFLPLLGLTLIPSILNKNWFKTLPLFILTALGTLFIGISPFVVEGTGPQISKVVKESVDQYPYISMSAFNFWELIFKENLGTIPDSYVLWGLKCKTWGSLQFFVYSFLILFPYTLLLFRKKITALNPKQIALIGSLICFFFFYFNTQMHERYIHPAFVFLCLFCVLEKKIGLLVFASITYFVNLEIVLDYFHIPSIHDNMLKKTVAVLYLIPIIYLINEVRKDLKPFSVLNLNQNRNA